MEAVWRSDGIMQCRCSCHAVSAEIIQDSCRLCTEAAQRWCGDCARAIPLFQEPTITIGFFRWSYHKISLWPPQDACMMLLWHVYRLWAQRFFHFFHKSSPMAPMNLYENFTSADTLQAKYVLSISDLQNTAFFYVWPEKCAKDASWNGKQCRAWLDYSSRSNLIWVSTFCLDLYCPSSKNFIVTFYIHIFAGGVGVTCWVLVCSSVVYRLKSFINVQPSSNELKIDWKLQFQVLGLHLRTKNIKVGE